MQFGQHGFVVSVVIKEVNRDAARSAIVRRLNAWLVEGGYEPPFPPGSLLCYSVQDSAWDYCDGDELDVLEAALWSYALTVDCRQRSDIALRLMARVSQARARRAVGSGVGGR